MFDQLEDLKHPIDVSISWRLLAEGLYFWIMKLSGQKWNECRLLDILYMPLLSYNQLSISKVTDLGNTIDFEKGCQIYNAKGKLIAEELKVGSLYYFNCSMCNAKVSVSKHKTENNIWHRRFGHLGIQSLQRLARSKNSEGIWFWCIKECKACVEGKYQRSHFPTSNRGWAKESLLKLLSIAGTLKFL